VGRILRVSDVSRKYARKVLSLKDLEDVYKVLRASDADVDELLANADHENLEGLRAEWQKRKLRVADRVWEAIQAHRPGAYTSHGGFPQHRVDDGDVATWLVKGEIPPPIRTPEMILLIYKVHLAKGWSQKKTIGWIAEKIGLSDPTLKRDIDRWLKDRRNNKKKRRATPSLAAVLEQLKYMLMLAEARREAISAK
jgi:hypothetical protein